MDDRKTEIIISEFKKLKLRPLSITHRGLISKDYSFYCKVFIKDDIYVITKMKILREKINDKLDGITIFEWNIKDSKMDMLEIIIKIR